MEIPFNLEKRLKNGEFKRRFTIRFNEDSSHQDVLYQFVQGLVDAGFAPEKEILEECKSLMELELN